MYEKKLRKAPEKWGEELDMISSILKYIEQRLDEAQQIKVYAKAVCIYGSFMKDIDRVEKILYYKKALKLHRKLARIFGIEEILKGYIAETNKLGQEIPSEYTNYVWSLEKLKEDFGKRKVNMGSPKIMGEYYLYNEVLKKYRQENEYTVKEISERTCSEKTYRALENGKRKAKQGTFKAIHEALEIPFGIYSSDIITDHYNDIKRVEYVKLLQRNGNSERALMELDILEKELGEKSKISQNIQFMEEMRAWDLFKKNLMEAHDFIDNTIRLLELTNTYPNKNGYVPFFTRNEMLLFIHKAIAYRKLGEIGKAIDILNMLWKQLQKSDVDVLYRQDEALLIIRLWNNLLMDEKKYEQALQKTMEGIHLCLKTNRGDKINAFVFELGWIMEQKLQLEQTNKNDKAYIDNFFCALYLSHLFGNKSEYEFMRAYIIKETSYL